jgi:hypothetical protein
MSELRDYPAGVILHAPHCVEGGNAPAVPLDAAYKEYPSRQLHFCFGGMDPSGALDGLAAAEIMPYVVVEPVGYGRHDYRPSSDQPKDATRALCSVCRGTHGEPAP